MMKFSFLNLVNDSTVQYDDSDSLLVQQMLVNALFDESEKEGNVIVILIVKFS